MTSSAYNTWFSNLSTWLQANPMPDPGSSVPTPLGIPGTWAAPIFEDDFTSASGLDTTKWRSGWFGQAAPVSSSESAAYSSAQIKAGFGQLSLTTAAIPATISGKTYPYTSGMVTTNPHDGRASGGFEFTHGAVEAKIYLPGASGKIYNFPAFWLDGQSWPNDGEIDIVEGLSGSAGYHFHGPNGSPGASVSGDFTGWHTYGVLWKPGSVQYYYDGVLVGTVSYTGTSEKPMYIILNNAVGPVGGQVMPGVSMTVDYVRAWGLPS